jgi:hypothetical protein
MIYKIIRNSHNYDWYDKNDEETLYTTNHKSSLVFVGSKMKVAKEKLKELEDTEKVHDDYRCVYFEFVKENR